MKNASGRIPPPPNFFRFTPWMEARLLPSPLSFSLPTPSGPHQCLGVGVGLLVHDDLRHLVVAAVGGHVQRRQVVVGDVVHGHVVVQQQLDAVEVVALRRHVERRQTVLEEGGRVRGERVARPTAAPRGAYLRLGQNRSSSVQKHLHHLLMATPGATVERSQTVLGKQTISLISSSGQVFKDRWAIIGL